jgi:protein gp37
MTKIEWADATWNPVTGCSKVSPGCAHCFAETLALTRLAGEPGYPGLPWTPENAEANVVLRPDRLDLPLRWRKPRRVFVNSMSDLFHERVPDGFIDRVFAAMAVAHWHIFQVLTKRPERMAAYASDPETPTRIGEAAREFARPGYGPEGSFAAAIFDHEDIDRQRAAGVDWLHKHPDFRWRVLWPVPNVWLGTSIESDRFVGRADALRETPAAVRFISAEPLLGPLPSLDLTGIDWLIVGGESGPGHRAMDPAWVRKLVHRADRAGTVAVFVKQASGARAGKQGNLPDDLWARKEYPR